MVRIAPYGFFTLVATDLIGFALDEARERAKTGRASHLA